MKRSVLCPVGRRTSVAGLVLGIALFATVLGQAIPAYASKCNPGRASTAGSWTTSRSNVIGQTVGGIEADILVLNPYVDSGVSGSYDRSVAALNYSGAGANDSFADIGWEEYANGSMHTFTRWADAEGNIHLNETCALGTVGDIYTYIVYWNHDASQALSFYRDGGQCGSTTAATDWTPDSGNVHAKINDYANQMPGGRASGSHESYSGIKLWWNSAWNAISGSAGSDDPLEFTSYYNSSTHNTVWDNECLT